ncbi:hypothetical protein A5792_28415 [Mycolicibacterium peregrinum]|uniref:Uncharacterized protein n=1 Tax=Mycolicibacterium peregrinum TaxID=43304 RepID=A0A1A0QSZ6_MYCPR|nr:hypothetical protein A5792_28415 [Mycolicibacterium peregrinum]
MEVAIRGVAWLLPRSINEITAIVKEYSTKLGVVAVFAGAVYWVLAVKNEQASVAPAPDVIGVLTKLVLPGLVLWAMAVLLFRIVVAFGGPPEKWSRRAVGTAALMAMIAAGAAVAMDAASRALGPLEQRWLDQVDASDPTVLRISAAFFSGGFVWMSWRMAGRALDRNRLMSDRIGVMSAGVMLCAFSIPLAGIVATGAVPGALRVVMFATFGMSIVLSLVSSICAAREWIDRYLRLTRSGVKVPRWGFSWWLIGLWALAMGMLFVQAALPLSVQNGPLGLALVVPPMLAMLGLIPMTLISVLFVRRVNTYYERHMARRSQSYEPRHVMKPGKSGRLPNGSLA